MKIKNITKDNRRMMDDGIWTVFGAGEVREVTRPIYSKNAFQIIEEKEKKVSKKPEMELNIEEDK